MGVSYHAGDQVSFPSDLLRFENTGALTPAKNAAVFPVRALYRCACCQQR